MRWKEIFKVDENAVSNIKNNYKLNIEQKLLNDFTKEDISFDEALKLEEKVKKLKSAIKEKEEESKQIEEKMKNLDKLELKLIISSTSTILNKKFVRKLVHPVI